MHETEKSEAFYHAIIPRQMVSLEVSSGHRHPLNLKYVVGGRHESGKVVSVSLVLVYVVLCLKAGQKSDGLDWFSCVRVAPSCNS